MRDVLLISCIVVNLALAQYPTTVMQTDSLYMEIYLPDHESGFYRGTRFDWSGMIRHVQYKNHIYYGAWQSLHDPEQHDHVTGPAEEFGMQNPLGYSETSVGEAFFKIGVGSLRKQKEKAYRFHDKYQLVDPGVWQVSIDSFTIRFEHTASESGFAYHYIKTLELSADEPVFYIRHKLTNTGFKPIVTDFYNHNFTRIDDMPVGPDYNLEFGFPVKSRRNLEKRIRCENHSLYFLEPLSESIFTEIDSLSGTLEDTHFVIKNTKTRAGVRVSGDQIPVKINLWGTTTAICPEPFFEFNILPGETHSWWLRYEFFEFDRK